jgi:hypothetical protein
MNWLSREQTDARTPEYEAHYSVVMPAYLRNASTDAWLDDIQSTFECFVLHTTEEAIIYPPFVTDCSIGSVFLRPICSASQFAAAWGISHMADALVDSCGSGAQ